MRHMGKSRVALVVVLFGMPFHASQAATSLNVSIAVFDPGVPADASLHRDLGIFPRIREIEAKLLPFALREALVGSGGWGAIRVIPEPDTAAELLVTGVIGRSDGEELEVNVRAIDARGSVWLDKQFSGRPGGNELYRRIAAELGRARAQLDQRTLDRVVEVSLLRYGNALAPSAFGDFLEENADGTFSIQRLPAEGDPMVARIKRLRETEYVITDAVDIKFEELYGEIASVNEVWRDYRRKNLEYQAGDLQRAESNRSEYPRGSYESLLSIYENYKFHRITAQEQDRLAVAFDNEVGPRVQAMEERVAELQGWVDDKYAEWNRILEELFEAETAIEPNRPVDFSEMSDLDID